MQEQEKLEEQQMELFGIRLPAEQLSRDIEQATSFWLTPTSLYTLVETYLAVLGEHEHSYILGDGPVKTLRLSQKMREQLLSDLRTLPRQISPVYREWERWLKGGNPHLAITFDQDAAAEHPKATFITPIHPLARQAAAAMAPGENVYTVLKTRSDEIEPGDYPFAIYQWQYHGIRDDVDIVPISTLPAPPATFIKLLNQATEGERDKGDLLTTDTVDRLEAQHYERWLVAREQHIDRMRSMVDYQHQSLETSHRARMALLEEQLQAANNEKIRRMRKAQIDNAIADYQRRLSELNDSTTRVDVRFQPIAYGVLCIEGK